MLTDQYVLIHTEKAGASFDINSVQINGIKKLHKEINKEYDDISTSDIELKLSFFRIDGELPDELHCTITTRKLYTIDGETF